MTRVMTENRLYLIHAPLSPHYDRIGEALEVGVAGDEGRPEAPGRRVYERIGHREAMGEGQVGRLQRERLVHRRDGRAAKRGDGFHRPLFAEIPPDHLVDFVDLDG